MAQADVEVRPGWRRARVRDPGRSGRCAHVAGPWRRSGPAPRSLEDVLDAGREPIQVGLEVGLELLPVGASTKVAQGELRGVVEGLARGLLESGVLVIHAELIEVRAHVEDVPVAFLKHGIQPPQDDHRQDDVAVLAADVDVTEDLVGDPPDVIRDPVQVAVGHARG